MKTDLSGVLLDLATDVAIEAGALVRRMRHDGVDVEGTKTSAVDVVTRADRASEQLIRERILAARPEDGFLGEEGDDVRGSSGVRWVVDPIDGTVNYLYGIPVYAVSIAAEVDGRVEAGVVYNPADGERYAARRGHGATLGDEPIGVRGRVPLDQALVGTGFNYRADLRDRQGKAVARMLSRVRDIRRGGSCALDLCGVASGRLDAYVEEGIHAWDHSAGRLVAEEAGARAVLDTGPTGGERVRCATPGLFDDFAALCADVGL